MATAIIKGMLEKGYPSDKLLACDPSSEQLDRLKNELRAVRKEIHTSIDNASTNECEILVLAVKPQILPNVAKALSSHIRADALIVSVAAGITLELLQGYLNGRAVVRCMPNTPALLGQGAAGLYASANTSEQQKTLAKGIFESVGLTQWLNSESDLDLVTAISGRVQPIFFYLWKP